MVVLGEVWTGEVELVVGHSQAVCGRKKIEAGNRVVESSPQACPMIRGYCGGTIAH